MLPLEFPPLAGPMQGPQSSLPGMGLWLSIADSMEVSWTPRSMFSLTNTQFLVIWVQASVTPAVLQLSATVRATSTSFVLHSCLACCDGPSIPRPAQQEQQQQDLSNTRGLVYQ